MKPIRVLLAGESWVSSSTHYKGWDFFQSAIYETGCVHLEKALTQAGMQFTHLPGHQAAVDFPMTFDELNAYDAIILSDLGANTLLLHPDTWLHGKSTPNRLKLLRDWVLQGGNLIMCGGYYSFSGIYGQAKYYRTPIEEILPVSIYPFDDRVETPEGAIPMVTDPGHPILSGLTGTWPALLGYNELTLKPDSKLLLTVNDCPLLAVRQAGAGKTLTWASDIGPHWCPDPFVEWEGYARLWVQALNWLVNG